MSFFLFVKQIVDMLYQYKFLDYIMVGLVLLLLVWLDLGGSYLSNAIQTVYLWMAGLFF